MGDRRVVGGFGEEGGGMRSRVCLLRDRAPPEVYTGCRVGRVRGVKETDKRGGGTPWGRIK
mgnify:CR=1 FL=1